MDFTDLLSRLGHWLFRTGLWNCMTFHPELVRDLLEEWRGDRSAEPIAFSQVARMDEISNWHPESYTGLPLTSVECELWADLME